MKLIESILHNTRLNPDKEAILLPLSDPPIAWSYRELVDRTLRAASGLAGAGLKPGMRVIITSNRLEETIPSVLGCLYSGITASIQPSPRPLPEGGCRYSGLIRKARELDFHALITAEAIPEAEIPVLETGVLMNTPPTPSPPVRDIPGIPAYIQFSSGTSGGGKGVMLSHKAIDFMLEDFALVSPAGNKTTAASWLPLFHDFGLFAGILWPLYYGSRALLCTPIQWLRNPKRFLRLLEEYAADVWFITPSGLFHTLRNLGDGAHGIRLPGMDSIILGGEPLHTATLKKILPALDTMKCPANVLRNGYGMAENTLYATITPRGTAIKTDPVQRRSMARNHARPGKDGDEILMENVSIGTPHGSNEVRICDDQDNPLPERSLGEIQIRSQTLFSGYYQRPDLSPVLTPDGWYRTGDRGYRANGELYFCGRKDDLIIAGGNNIAPEEIEALTYDIDGIFPERSAAFGIHDPDLGTASIALMVEGRRGLSDNRKQEIIRQLAARIYRETGQAVREVRLVPRGWICRTRNGKIARARTRKKFLDSPDGNLS